MYLTFILKKSIW